MFMMLLITFQLALLTSPVKDPPEGVNSLSQTFWLHLVTLTSFLEFVAL